MQRDDEAWPLFVWHSGMSWYGPYADRDLAELGRERLHRQGDSLGYRPRDLRIGRARYTASGIEFAPTKRGES